MAKREYRMTARAAAQDETRDRIVRATMALHDEHGVAATTVLDIARRAGLGAATVYRHFPTIGELVMACGAHVWAEMRPPVPAEAAGVFDGVTETGERIARLAAWLDDFYRRGELRLRKAGNDRDVVPELDAFLRAVETGVAALVREALSGAPVSEPQALLAIALAGFPVWRALYALGLSPTGTAERFRRVLHVAVDA